MNETFFYILLIVYSIIGIVVNCAFRLYQSNELTLADLIIAIVACLMWPALAFVLFLVWASDIEIWRNK
jgi:hypothetical protein